MSPRSMGTDLKVYTHMPFHIKGTASLIILYPVLPYFSFFASLRSLWRIVLISPDATRWIVLTEMLDP